MPEEQINYFWAIFTGSLVLITLVVLVIAIIIIAQRKKTYARKKEREYLRTIKSIRERLSRNWAYYESFGSTDFAALKDKDLIEILVSFNPSVENAKITAEDLIDKYGSLRAVIDALVGQQGPLEGISERHTFIMRIFKSVSERYLSQNLIDLPYGNSSKAIYDYLYHSMRGLEYEKFKLISLNAQNKIISIDDLANGTTTEAMVYIREVLKQILVKNAVSVVFVHNHIARDVKPSRDDIDLTKQLTQACKLFDVDVLDHIIIGDNTYFSFAESGMITGERIKC